MQARLGCHKDGVEDIMKDIYCMLGVVDDSSTYHAVWRLTSRNSA